MKRSGAGKFPQSVQLFKFCQKIMMHRKGVKVRDQEIGSILNFNPSDCSHWKRGEKSVRSIFALQKLADALSLETSLIHDVASGASNLDEAFFEFLESGAFKTATTLFQNTDAQTLQQIRERTSEFVAILHKECEFSTPPLYLPEVLRAFAFITTQPTELMERLSRVLRTKPGQYTIQYKKGELKPQTRMSIVKDLARIVFEAERSRFPELGALDPQVVVLEEVIFTANLLIPKGLLLDEMAKLDTRVNVVAELANLFWVPKSLVSFQLQDLLREGNNALKFSLGRETTTTASLVSTAS